MAKNQEVKRKVIGQILEYGAYMWRLSYEELDDKIKKKTGDDLISNIKSYAGEEFDEELFINNIKDTLNRGSFLLMIVVDRVNDDLKQIIEYINENNPKSFSLYALEMNRYKAHKVDIIVPKIFGVSKIKLSPRPSRYPLTKEEVISLYKKAGLGEYIYRILEIAENADKQYGKYVNIVYGSSAYIIAIREDKTERYISISFDAKNKIGLLDVWVYATELRKKVYEWVGKVNLKEYGFDIREPKEIGVSQKLVAINISEMKLDDLTRILTNMIESFVKFVKGET